MATPDPGVVQVPKRKVIVYIDGFNLYFALREKGWLGFMWLDLLRFSQNLIREDQALLGVKYFTSRIKNDPEKQKRQSLYLDALGTLNQDVLKIYYGDYQANDFPCWHCGRLIEDQQEKQTDVNIATHMLVDSMSRDKVDDIILVTADSDQCPSVTAARAIGKTVLVALPPGRGHYIELKTKATSSIELTAKKFKTARLPDVILAGQFEIKCPTKWLNR